MACNASSFRDGQFFSGCIGIEADLRSAVTIKPRFASKMRQPILHLFAPRTNFSGLLMRVLMG